MDKHIAYYSDVYSVGMLLYHIMTLGRAPFTKPTLQDPLYRDLCTDTDWYTYSMIEQHGSIQENNYGH